MIVLVVAYGVQLWVTMFHRGCAGLSYDCATTSLRFPKIGDFSTIVQDFHTIVQQLH
jgi:hypothetical protein